jgi:hypothetical protein
MDWNEQIDSYCERVDFSYWAEPINALTNAAFLIAAIIMWYRVRGQGLPLAMGLVAILAAIGIGSYLFHTHATIWAVTADVVPILIYILLYIFVANYAFWGFGLWLSLGLTALFIPYAALTVPLWDALGFLGSSSGYAPVPLLIYIYAFLLRHRLPDVARGLAIGATILVVSIAFRTVDLPACDALPFGTHFIWHILNGVMLGWMIEVYRRHALATRATGG